MRILPRSLSGRLLALSALTTAAALAIAAVGVGRVLERFLIHGLDQQLDLQVALLARAVGPDGRLDRTRLVDLPAFEEGRPGWGWRIDGPGGRWRGGDAIDVASPPETPPGRGPDRDGVRPAEGRAASGEPVHLRAATLATPAGRVQIVAAGPRRPTLAPLREAMAPLLATLAILGAALAAAAVVQLRLGLRPLRALRGAVADVRAGRAARVPLTQPEELAPLAAELNALIDANEAQLAHARRHVANLAHGLKTPLAALAVRLAEDGRDPDGALRGAVAELDGRVRHHLGRARAAAPGGAGRARTSLAPAVAELVAVMRGVHADRTIALDVEAAPDLVVAADPQDLDEMLGNLLDNAWRHARSRVAVAANAAGPLIDIAIEDDGPGLPPAAAVEALRPGRRLDERGDGHGFGLPIAQELAELYGGALTLDASPSLGGLRAVLSVPTPADR